MSRYATWWLFAPVAVCTVCGGEGDFVREGDLVPASR